MQRVDEMGTIGRAKGSGFLLDTNVISELSKRQVHPEVVHFLSTTPDDAKFLSVLTLGELRLGVLKLERHKPDQAAKIALWVDQVEETFEERTLVVDARVTRNWARFNAERDRPRIDTLLAATAFVHGLTLVTRNILDSAGLEIDLYNPWWEDKRQ